MAGVAGFVERGIQFQPTGVSARQRGQRQPQRSARVHQNAAAAAAGGGRRRVRPEELAVHGRPAGGALRHARLGENQREGAKHLRLSVYATGGVICIMSLARAG